MLKLKKNNLLAILVLCVSFLLSNCAFSLAQSEDNESKSEETLEQNSKDSQVQSEKDKQEGKTKKKRKKRGKRKKKAQKQSPDAQTEEKKQ